MRFRCAHAECSALGWARQHLSYNSKSLRRVVIGYVCSVCKGAAQVSIWGSGGERFYCNGCAPAPKEKT